MKNLRKKLNKKGFTLAEMLIVVAIIAVLVAVSIPVFTSKLEKAREATDIANMRAAKAAAVAAYLSEDALVMKDGDVDTETVFYYDAANGKLSNTNLQVGYGQGTAADGKLEYENYANDFVGKDKVIYVKFLDDGEVEIDWTDKAE